jgi:hypothetical protein
MDRYPETLEVLKKAISEGKFTIEGTETKVPTKFEDIPQTWQLLFSVRRFFLSLTFPLFSAKLTFLFLVFAGRKPRKARYRNRGLRRTGTGMILETKNGAAMCVEVFCRQCFAKSDEEENCAQRAPQAL